MGSFPTLGKLKYYFSDVKTHQRSAGNRLDLSPIPPVDSDPEVAKLRHQALLDQRMTQRNKNPNRTASERNEPGLDNLINQVTNIIPTSRLDKKNEVCVGTVPAKGQYDIRGSLNQRNGITEQCIGEIQGTTSQGSSQEEVVSEGSGTGPFSLWGSRATGDEK